MCGIAGLAGRPGTRPDPAALATLRAALAHRGPDGGAQVSLGPTGLVHTRLAIIDLETGDQPLIGAQGTHLIGNGEIYNYVELRDEFSAQVLRSRSDFEPALHVLERDGPSGIDRLRGMYALATADPDGRNVLLSRDPFGIKPLYLCDTPSGIAFASEPAALIRAGYARPALDPRARDEFLNVQYVSGTETVFADIRKVPPGETLVLRDGAVVERRHRPCLPDGPAATARDEDKLIRAFDTVFEDSVRVHQRADVPYGLFLSGGLDSSAVLAMMARLNDQAVTCFTAGFDGVAVHDERPAARALARALGAEHIEVTFGEQDFLDLLPRIAAALDEPVADYAVLPTYKLARTARAAVKVVLSGEGGDEILGGYGRYRRLMRPWWLGGRAPPRRGLLADGGLMRPSGHNWWATLAEAETAARRPGRSRLQAAQAFDIATWLPNDLLVKLDRCLMAHGVEGRTPFLDPRVADFAFALPDDMKVRGKLGKWLLRAWLDRHCPAAQAFARKRGFTVPVGQWIRRRAGDLGERVAAQPGVAEACAPEAVRRLFSDLGDKKRQRMAWILLFYAAWHAVHCEGKDSRLGLFDLLDPARAPAPALARPA